VPDISKWFAVENLLHTSGGGLLGIFMLLGFIKGVAKQLLGMGCLLIGFIAGYIAFRYAPIYLQKLFGVVDPHAVMITSIVVGGIVHQLCRRVVRGLLTSDMGAPQHGGHRVRSALFSVIPTCFLLWVLAMVVRWTGVLSQMKFLDEGLREATPSIMEKLPLLVQLQKSLTKDWVGAALNQTDPISSTEAGALCSLLLVQRDHDSWMRLRQDPDCAQILKHPSVQRLVQDKDWSKPASFQNYAQLLMLPELNEALKDKVLADQLRKINVEQKVRNATGNVPAE
jgi:hypothetical protein